jgi:DNA-binding NtrC family response regulator
MIAGKVLIVDDEDAFLNLYERKLGKQGYLVEAAKDRDSALKKLEAPGWDAVLVDQRLQGVDGPDSGLDLIPEIVRRAPRARILLVTGYATAKARPSPLPSKPAPTTTSRRTSSSKRSSSPSSATQSRPLAPSARQG